LYATTSRSARSSSTMRILALIPLSLPPLRSPVARACSDSREELVVVFKFLQLAEKLLHRLRWLVVRKRHPQESNLFVLLLGEELFFLPRAGLRDVDRREDPLLGERPVEGDLHIAGALELLEDHLVHPRAGVDQRRAD